MKERRQRGKIRFEGGCGGGAPAIFVLLVFVAVSSSTAFATARLPTIAFDEAYSPLFGENNIVSSDDGRSVILLLDRFSGSGFISSETYEHGFFSAKIKLPSDYTAGIVVAFYASNGDVFPKSHDEVDFEFLGNVKGRPWRLQTNLYGDGSVRRGREERYFLPFDPSKSSHRYSVLWTSHSIIFYIDETPIREVRRSSGGDFPSKPMSIYATIWDASTWATSGGKYKVNYRYSPFAANFSDLVIIGCRRRIRNVNADELIKLPTDDLNDRDDDDDDQRERRCDIDGELSDVGFGEISPEDRRKMQAFREKYMTYSVCYDVTRYPFGLPDCDIVPSEKKRFRENGHMQLTGRRRYRRRSRPSPAAAAAAVRREQQEETE